ncbi:hypothetical protein EDB80DRAFT_140047 [Ilyonectria destructans]|nr:hypothetical protein EDB80DRAFT_140047 [Ilyonectria destructans]
MHIKACHAEAEFACSHPDCHQDPTLYMEWSLNFHLLDQHDDAVFSRRFPGCGFFSRGRLRRQRVKSTISHLVRRHAVSTRNIQNLQLLPLREVHDREAMTDPSWAYINVCANVAVEAPLVPLPPGIVNDCRPAGVKRDVQTDCDGIYEQLCEHADFRAGDEIYNFNLYKMRSPRYDGQLYYREGIRCAGATDAISCAKRCIISLRNTIVRTSKKQNVNGLPQLTMVLPMIYETCRGVCELVNGMFAKGQMARAIDRSHELRETRMREAIFHWHTVLPRTRDDGRRLECLCITCAKRGPGEFKSQHELRFANPR